MTETQPSVARPATIYDVARAAGVSHATVSRLLKGEVGMRPGTRDRVAEAIRELGYRPNLNARSLTTGRSHRIAALTHEITQVGPSKILEGASVAAREAGYLLDVITLDRLDSIAIRKFIELALHLDVAGVLALASTDEVTNAVETATFPVPVYLAIDDYKPPTDSTTTPSGLFAVLSHLADLGHRDVLHIAGPRSWVGARNRIREYEEAVATLGLRSRGVIYGDWSARSGYEAIASLPDELPATAIVAANDQSALGVILALNDRGYRVPDDVSVTGVDDTPEAAYFSPPLTTLRLDFAAGGREVVQQLIALIDGVTPPPRQPRHSELIVRRSTGPVRPRP
jgi:DNA-binding LacI/PurR family transcriptional regulator